MARKLTPVYALPGREATIRWTFNSSCPEPNTFKNVISWQTLCPAFRLLDVGFGLLKLSTPQNPAQPSKTCGGEKASKTHVSERRIPTVPTALHSLCTISAPCLQGPRSIASIGEIFTQRSSPRLVRACRVLHSPSPRIEQIRYLFASKILDVVVLA